MRWLEATDTLREPDGGPTRPNAETVAALATVGPPAGGPEAARNPFRRCRNPRLRRFFNSPPQPSAGKPIIGFSTGYPQEISRTYPPESFMPHCFSLARLKGDCERPLTATDRKTPGGAQRPPGALGGKVGLRSGSEPQGDRNAGGSWKVFGLEAVAVSQGPERATKGLRVPSGCGGSMNCRKLVEKPGNGWTSSGRRQGVSQGTCEDRV